MGRKGQFVPRGQKKEPLRGGLEGGERLKLPNPPSGDKRDRRIEAAVRAAEEKLQKMGVRPTDTDIGLLGPEVVAALERRSTDLGAGVSGTALAARLAQSRLPRTSRLALGRMKPGLHLLYGPAGSGKSVNSLALYVQLLAAGIPVLFDQVMEPRGALFSEDEQPVRARAGELLSVTSDSILREMRIAAALAPSRIEGFYNEYIRARLLDAADEGSRYRSEQAAASQASNVPGVLIIDSLTHNISDIRLAAGAPEIEKVRKDVTFTKGLSSSFIRGALIHNLLAEAFGVILIGIVNSSLLPVVADFEGAVEGLVRSEGAGYLIEDSRGTGRKEITTTLPPWAIELALIGLGYKASIAGPAPVLAPVRREDLFVGSMSTFTPYARFWAAR